MLRQGDDAFYSVYDPTEDDLAGVIICITSFHLFHGGDVFAVLVVGGVQRTEYFVNRVQEAPQVLAAFLGAALH